jgi:hypothetical protein
LFGSGQRVEEIEELLDASHLESILYAVADTDKVQAPSFFLMGGVRTHQGADSGGVDIGDVAKIQEKGAGIVGANLGLKVEKVADDERPIKTQNALTFLGADQIFDDKRLLWHRKILVPGAP